MLKRIMFSIASLIALALMQPISAGADQLIITAGGSANPSYTKDATIFQNDATRSNDAGPGLFAGTNNNDSPRRGLIWFDVVGRDAALYHAIKNATSIDSVKVHMWLGMAAGSGGGNGGGGGTCPGGDPTDRDILLHRIIDAGESTGMWGGAEATGASTQIGGTGGGATAVTDDATWRSRRHSSDPDWDSWSDTPPGGGDYEATVSATTTVSNSCPQKYTWTHANMITDVKEWLGIGPSYPTALPNYGWIVIGDEDDEENATFRAFYTKEAEAQVTPVLGPGPSLEINYTP